MKGAIVVEVGAAELEAARAALARAVASGALGPGRAVRRDGAGLVFGGAGGGRIDVTADGRVTFDVAVAGARWARVAEAVAVAALVSVAGTLGWSLMLHAALPTGGAVGLAYALARGAGDRARLGRQIRALVASLPVLVDTRG